MHLDAILPSAAGGRLRLLLAATAALRVDAGGNPLNAQLYPCNSSEPWHSRQVWTFAAPGPGPITLKSSGASLQLQLPSPNFAKTCPSEPNASCWNLIAGSVKPGLPFRLSGSQLIVDGGRDTHPAGLNGLCVATSNSGTASTSQGFLANVFLTECSTASAKSAAWSLTPASENEEEGLMTVRTGGQCLDIGSGGSHGDLGFELSLLPAAPLEQQAFRSSEYVSWGGSVIQADSGDYHMFAAVFSGGKGLNSWTSNSEIMHLQAKAPSGPFKPANDGPNLDGIIVQAEAHNPKIVRANDGTYLLFSIGHSPFLASPSLNGPWHAVNFTHCNNPAPLVVPGRDEIYVYCHGGPDIQHWGSSVGMAWTPHWSAGVWTIADNNTDDLHGGGRDLFAHPVEVSSAASMALGLVSVHRCISAHCECDATVFACAQDPFAWYAPSNNPAANGSFHLLCHGFRMGMVNNSAGIAPSALTEDEGSGNAYGAYANAPTPFGPWRFQESAVAYSGHVQLSTGKSLGTLQRRERPHLLLSKEGLPTHLYNGVCLEGGYDRNASSAEHCFTFAQAVAPSLQSSTGE